MKTNLTLSTLALALGLTAAGLTQAASVPLPKDLPAYGQDKPLPVPQVARRTLPNGLLVWVVQREGLPKVNVALVTRGGTAADAPATPALSQLMASLFNEGTARYSSRQLAEALQAIGGDYSASADDDGINVRASALASHTPELLRIVADTVLHPAFPASEVALAKANAEQALKVRQAEPEWQAQRAFNHAVWGDHPYANGWLTEASIQAATPQALHALHDARVRPERSLLVIVGRIDATAAFAQAEQAFGGWKDIGPAATDTATEPAGTTPQHLLVTRAGAVQSNIRYGRPAVPLKDADYIALNLASTILGGGFTSRLMQDIREDKGYSYSPYAGLAANRASGYALAGVDVRNEVTGATLDELGRIYASMGSAPPSAEELNGAKRLVTGIYLLRNQLQGAVAGSLADYWAKGLPPSFLGSYVAETDKVTAAQVQAMGRKYFDPRQQSIVVVGDPKAIEAQLKPFGSFSPFQP